MRPLTSRVLAPSSFTIRRKLGQISVSAMMKRSGRSRRTTFRTTEAQIQGKEEGPRGFRHALPGHLLPALRSGGEHDTGGRVTLPQLPDQRMNRRHFAQGNRMHPDPGLPPFIAARVAPGINPSFWAKTFLFSRGKNHLAKKNGAAMRKKAQRRRL